MNWIQRWKLKRLLSYQVSLEKWIAKDKERLKQYQKTLRRINKQIKGTLK